MEPTPCSSPANRTRLADFLAALAPERLAREPMLPSRPLTLALALALASTLTAQAAPDAGAGRTSSTAAPTGLDPAFIDRSVRPGDDFFRYANGKWLGSTEIPPDRSAWGASGELEERLRLQTREILEAAARSNAAPGSLERKVGDFYASAMDEAAAESKGVAPLKPALSRIAALKTKADLATYLGEELRADVDAMDCTSFQTSRLFGLWVAPDLATPTRSVPYLLQGGLGMPDREYYLSTDPTMVETRDKYRAHVETILTLAGIKDAAQARCPGGGPRDEDGPGPRHAARVPRGQERQQPLARGRVGEAGTGPGLDALLPGRRTRRTAGGLRLAPEGDRGAVGARRPRAARGLEGLGDVPRRRSPLGLPRQGLPGRGVRLLRPRALRDGRAARALEAGPELDGRRRGRGGGPPVRRAPFLAAGEGQGLGDGEVHRRGVRPPDRCARLDGAVHQG